MGEIRSESKFITNEFLYAWPGVFDHLEGFEELKKEGIITEYLQFKWKGAEIFRAVSSSDRVASFTIQADTYEEMVSKHDQVAARIRLVDPEGKDIMRHDLLTPIAPL